MATIGLQGGAKKQAVYAVVRRADGSVRGKALVAYANRNPIIHLAVNAYIAARDALGLRGF